MKSQLKITTKFLFVALCIFYNAVPSFSQQHIISRSSTSDKGWNTIKISDDDGHLEIKYTGEITLNDDETAIKNMSPDGSLVYKKNGTVIKVTADASSQIFYEVNGSSRKSTLDKDESALLASAIQTMIANGVGAKDRVERIYKKTGSRGVLTETGKLKSDYVKGIYLNYLLETATLSGDEMTEIASNVKEIIRSDYEKGKLLSKFSEKYLANPATAKAYLAAVKSISSDYEKGKALKIILKQPLAAAQFSEVLQVAGSISSDYERAGVMKQILTNNKISGSQFSEVLKIIISISSDYEKANVLKKILTNSEIPASQFSEVLKATASIGSDYEKANILKYVLKNNKLPEAQFSEALDVVSSLSSDHEKSNILKQVAAGEIGNEAQWLRLISAAEKISSDYEKASVLIKLAARMQTTENIKSAYAKAARTISSDHEYGRTVRAVK